MEQAAREHVRHLDDAEQYPRAVEALLAIVFSTPPHRRPRSIDEARAFAGFVLHFRSRLIQTWKSAGCPFAGPGALTIFVADQLTANAWAHSDLLRIMRHPRLTSHSARPDPAA